MIAESDWLWLRSLLQQEAGCHGEHLQPVTVYHRLANLAEKHHQSSVGNLIRQWQVDPALGDKTELVEALLNYETRFFRDPTLFQLLQTEILPELLALRPAGLQIWSAACASGQEPYSLAMLWVRYFAAGARLNLTASDYSGKALALARQACYSRHEIEHALPPGYKDFFYTEGSGYRLQEGLREQVRFLQLNLSQDWQKIPERLTGGASPGMDLILLRNVLIYIASPFKEQILAAAAQMLRTGGYLILGTTESLMPLPPALMPRHLSLVGGCFQKK